MNYKALSLEPGENVIYQVRRHWIVFFGYTVGLVFLGTLPLITFTLLEMFLPGFFDVNVNGNIYALLVFLYSLWVLVLWISFFLDWTKYYLDVWYVTEKRIIMIDQKQLFNREVSNVRFDKIQDVSVEVPGFLSTLLDFGNIKVQTASEGLCEFNMRVIRHPGMVREVIFSKHNEIGDKASTRDVSGGV